MTNITLSIEEEVYKLMRRHSEIKWSEFVRKIIKKRLEDLEKIEALKDKGSFLTMLASEKVLARDWDTKEEDEAWNDL